MENTHKFSMENTHKFSMESTHKFSMESTHKFSITSLEISSNVSKSHRNYPILCAISILLLAAFACSLPMQAAPATPTSEPPTAASSETPLPPTLTVAPTASVAPQPDTETPTPSDTVTATLETGVFPTDTPTATLEPITAKLTRTSDCFSGPAGNYDLVATYPNGTKLIVIARDLGGGFIFIQDPSSPTTQCYILAANAQLSANPTVLPQNTAIASPTGSAGITASFKRYDDCKGNPYTLFTIVNTGGTPLRSAYMRVTDLKTGQFTEWSADAFDLWQGCIIAQNYAPLNPGSIGYLRSGQFAKNPRGDKMRAVIHACTQKGLRGFCVDIAVLFQ